MLRDKDGDHIDLEVLHSVDGYVYYLLRYPDIKWFGKPLDAIGNTIDDTLTLLYNRKSHLKKEIERYTWES